MPLECGTIVGVESRESNVGKLGPQQRNEVESRYAPASPEELAHQALRPIPANRAPYPPRCDDPQPAAFETVRTHEQGQVTAADPHTKSLDAEELPAPPNPVVPRQSTLHVPRRRERPPEGVAVDSLTTRKGAFAPLRGGASRFPCPLSCSSACEIRASACGAGCSADKCASCPRHPRGPPAGPPYTQTNIVVGNSPSSQCPGDEPVPLFHRLIPCCRGSAGVVDFRSPAASWSPPRDFHRVWKKLWKNGGGRTGSSAESA